MAQAFKIYLSSTLKDLDAERQAVKAVLGGEAVVKESYHASETDLVASCLEDVAGCDLYIGIVGLRYGFVPEKPGDAGWNPDHRSITELEYEAALKRGVPRHVFLKDKRAIAATDTDSDSGENGGGAQIKRFRELFEKGTELRADSFDTAESLKTKVLHAFMEFKSRREGGAAFMQSSPRHPAALDRDVALAFVPGTDDAESARIKAAARDNRFRVFDLGPDARDYLSALDRQVRRSQAICWVFTPASLARQKGQAAGLEAALPAIAGRTGARFALLSGSRQADLDPRWPFDAVVEIGAGELLTRPEESLAALYRRVRERAGALETGPLVGVPYVVLALREDEATKLADTPEELMKGFADDEERALRQDQAIRLRDGVRRSAPDWPRGFYGTTREDWAPFGARHPKVTEILRCVVAEINEARVPGSSEARLLGDAAIRLERYALDEFASDRLGAHAVLENLRDRGSLVLVDEFALLHPKIRAIAVELLQTQRAALGSAHPADPSWQALEKVLGDVSHLGVGTLLTRFKNSLDYRCEVSMSSPMRLRRWLRLVLPALVSTLGAVESQPELVKRADEKLFA